MPLQFESMSHGKIAFGFFNIETDMILLNHYFLFASDFCHSLSEIADTQDDFLELSWDIYSIEEEERIGNLMGAIYGKDCSGFIGEVYKLFPFPKEQKEFKQRTDGFKNRPAIEQLIQKFGKRICISFMIDRTRDRVGLGEYLFTKASFHELIRYIWLGGYPRWKANFRPDYVLSMKERIEKSKHFLFEGLILDQGNGIPGY